MIFGMLAGIGILIFASQFHVMVDDKPRGTGLANLLSIPQSFVKGFTPDQGLPHNEAAFIGVATIATLVIWGKYKPASMRLVPGALVAIVLATFTTWLLQFPIQRVDVPSNLLSAVRLPMLDRLPAMLSPEFLRPPWAWRSSPARKRCVRLGSGSHAPGPAHELRPRVVRAGRRKHDLRRVRVPSHDWRHRP